MSNQSSPTPSTEEPKLQAQDVDVNILLSPEFKIKQNHLSATFQNLLQHEQKNIQIQFVTKNTRIPKTVIQSQVKLQPLLPSTLKGQEIFQKYGSMIENQPIFLRELIFHQYLDYLPQKFQNEFSRIVLMGSGFEFAWWGSLALVLVRAYRNRHVEASLKQKGMKALGLGFVFIASSLGFHQHFYIPKLKKCYYNNIKTVDSMMDRHIKILKLCGGELQLPQKQTSQSPSNKSNSATLTNTQNTKKSLVPQQKHVK